MTIRSIFPTLAVLAVLLTACGTVGYKEVPQYTIEQFMDKVTYGGSSFSPDETNILLMSDKSGVFNAWTVNIESGALTQVTKSETEAIFPISYFPLDQRILYESDQGGNEISHIYLLDEQGNSRDLTPNDGARASFAGWMYDDQSFLYESNARDPRFLDIYEMNIETFESTPIYLNDSGYFFGGISDDERYLAFLKVITEHNNEMYLLDRQTGEMMHLTPHEGDVAFSPSGFSVHSESLYYLTNANSEYNYLMRFDIESGLHEKVFETNWDVLYAYFSRSGKYRVIAINNDAKTEIRVDNMETGQPVKLPEMPDANITSVRISRSEELMTFYVEGSRSPRNLFTYNLKTSDYKQLTHSMTPEIDIDNLVDAQVVRYKSFDALEIPALLYKPHQIRPEESAPAIVMVHGGPGGQARVGYSSDVQYFVNHGYVVIDVNNRGSSGYGKTFFKADDMRHGEDDLADCVYAKHFLATTGYVDTSRVAIMGGSYGGYMVLAALAFQPEAFAAGVDYFGISNWVRTLESIPPYWEAFREALYVEMGNPSVDGDYLLSISPLFHADKIRRPLMVLQGANDPRVIQPESDDIVEAVKNNGVPVEYLVFEDEGHGFLKKENRIEASKAALTFLDTYLKGQAEDAAQ
ncbi:MAG: prolyl oligopeptidase family serine peptidase [Candidatus Zixiibacteriota bacterium]